MSADNQQSTPKRPDSTILQGFSADLDSIFGMNPEIEALSQTVEAKKQTVTSGEQQLQELEARLRETERRLAKASRHNSPARGPPNVPSPRTLPERNPAREATIAQSSPLAQQQTPQSPNYPPPRPPHGMRQDTQTMMRGMPGAMPETPKSYNGNSNDYVMVDRTGGGRAERGYA